MSKHAYNVDETPTPIHVSTRTYLSWRTAAAELAVKVSKMPQPEAAMMYEDLKWFEDQFQAWTPQNSPDDATRVRIINEFADLNRKIHDFIVQNRKTSSIMPRRF